MKIVLRKDLMDPPRRGYILVLFAFLMLILIGMLGLIIDTGILLSSHRQAQNAADSAARACARRIQYEERQNGFNAIDSDMTGTLQPIANLYSLSRNTNGGGNSNLLEASVTIHHPPLPPSPYATDLAGSNGHFARRYVEVNVSLPVGTFFIQALGVASSRLVTARAVAGYESTTIPGPGIVVLDPNGSPGLDIGGANASATLDTSVFDYSLHQGLNGFGDTVGTISLGQPAASVNGGAKLITPAAYVSGGVDVVANFSPPNVGLLSAGNLSPVFDPYFTEGTSLPTPTTANGVLTDNYGTVSIGNNETRQLFPGIYNRITITGGTVVFNPGIYVLQPMLAGNNALSITGGKSTGNGIMFYNTGTKYNVNTGLPDISDLSVATDYAPTQADSNGENFSGISINSMNVTFTPMTSGSFKDILIYQRRFNTQTISINAGLAPPGGLNGQLYAKWAKLKLAGNGTYNFGIITGTLGISGNAKFIVPNLTTLPEQKIQLIYLVE